MVRELLVLALSALLQQAPPTEPRLELEMGSARLRPEEGITEAALSPDGTMLVVGSSSFTAWNVRSGEKIGRIGWHRRFLSSLAFTPDGKRLASGGTDGSVRIWDVKARKEVIALPGHGRMVHAILFSDDGKTLISADSDGVIRSWDLSSRKETWKKAAHPGGALSIAVSSDGKTLASGGRTGAVKLWERATGKELRSIAAHPKAILTLGFSPDGEEIATASLDGTVGVWKTSSGNNVRVMKSDERGARTVAFSPDGRFIVSGGGEGKIRIWESATGRERHVLQGHQKMVRGLEFLPDKRKFISSGYDKTIRIWDVENGKEVAAAPGHAGRVMGVSFSPDMKQVASIGEDSTVRIWDAETGRELRRLPGHGTYVATLAYSPGGDLLATAGSDKVVKLWKASTGEELRTLEGHTSAIRSISFSSDGMLLASAGFDKTVRIWDPGTGRPLSRPFEGHEGAVMSVAFSPDGSLLASGDQARTIRLWDVATGRVVGELEAHDPSVAALAFSPDGRVLVSAGSGPSLRIWELASGKTLHRPQGHLGLIFSISFSPHGHTFASSANDGTIRLWDVATGEERGRVKVGERFVDAIAFSPDGKKLVSGSISKVKIWGELPAAKLEVPKSTDPLETLWADLASTDAPTAFWAVRALAGRGEPAAAFLKRKLLASSTSAEAVKKLVHDLGDANFETRAQAFQKLRSLSHEPAVWAALDTDLSAEALARKRELVAIEHAPIIRSTKTLRRSRAVWALEFLGSPATRQVLQELAVQNEGPRLVREAKAAFRRPARGAASVIPEGLGGPPVAGRESPKPFLVSLSLEDGGFPTHEELELGRKLSSAVLRGGIGGRTDGWSGAGKLHMMWEVTDQAKTQDLVRRTAEDLGISHRVTASSLTGRESPRIRAERGKDYGLSKEAIENDLKLEAALAQAGPHESGAPVDLTAWLVNQSKDRVYPVITPGDGSGRGLREPTLRMSAQVRGPDGAWQEAPRSLGWAGCGTFDRLWHEDFFELRSGGKLDISNSLWSPTGDYELREPGLYRVRVFYEYGKVASRNDLRLRELPGAIQHIPAYSIASPWVEVEIKKSFDLVMEPKKDLKRQKVARLSDLAELAVVNTSGVPIEVTLPAIGGHSPFAFRAASPSMKARSRKAGPFPKLRASQYAQRTVTIKPGGSVSILGPDGAYGGLDYDLQLEDTLEMELEVHVRLSVRLGGKALSPYVRSNRCRLKFGR